MCVKTMSARQKKLVQRFLAAVAAFFFVSYNLFFPVTVQASPVFGLAAAVEDALFFAPAAEVAAGLATGGLVAVGGLAIGAAYYAWTQSQTDAVKTKATTNYCLANPSVSGCPPASTAVWHITRSGCYENYGKHCTSDTGDPAPVDIPVSQVPDGNFSVSYNGTFSATSYVICYLQPTNTYLGGWYDAPPGLAVTKVLPGTGSQNYSSLSPSDQQSALQTLTDDDVNQILQNTASPGKLSNGQTVPKGSVIGDPTGKNKAFITTAPYTVGSGQPIPGDPATCTSDCSAFNQGTGTSTKAGTGTGTGTSSSNPSPSPSPTPSPSDSPTPSPSSSPEPQPATDGAGAGSGTGCGSGTGTGTSSGNPDLLSHLRDILMPGGNPVGVAGSTPDIRVLSGGVSDGLKFFDSLTQGGVVNTSTNYPGMQIKLPNGLGYVSIRTEMSNSPNTAVNIDVNIPCIPNITKLKFNP